ncbi:oxidoreductase [Thioclava dalianensis]|uniref:Oxidoreductase n=1 Tax=Thioclava dalianensis TaxID=1185766 RepID=A0A074U7H4_9RHOB|nr:aldo/keto reductase [Thioclava dalianensis]KEP70642.1 oxidoreductase [Thioclava dalianensis]SFN05888.1 2,5-diketo-D-gluconate reductase A [Thioclava dalianensis]
MSVPMITLNDGTKIPQLGLGVWKMPEEETPGLIMSALNNGYRHIDTAAAYGNEAGVGRGILESGVPRDEIFITTKLWNDRQGYDETLRAFDESMGKLGLETLDLYLIHWPMPNRGHYVDTWKAFVKLQQEGRIRAIGVSNFLPEHLERLIDETGITPALNQVELHPRFQQSAQRAAHAKLGIATECWSPLGQGEALSNPVLTEIASRHGKSVAQVILRWQVQLGCITIPKSSNHDRMRENITIFDFELSDAEMARIKDLDAADGRIGSDPATADF